MATREPVVEYGAALTPLSPARVGGSSHGYGAVSLPPSLPGSTLGEHEQEETGMVAAPAVLPGELEDAARTRPPPPVSFEGSGEAEVVTPVPAVLSLHSEAAGVPREALDSGEAIPGAPESDGSEGSFAGGPPAPHGEGEGDSMEVACPASAGDAGDVEPGGSAMAPPAVLLLERGEGRAEVTPTPSVANPGSAEEEGALVLPANLFNFMDEPDGEPRPAAAMAPMSGAATGRLEGAGAALLPAGSPEGKGAVEGPGEGTLLRALGGTLRAFGGVDTAGWFDGAGAVHMPPGPLYSLGQNDEPRQTAVVLAAGGNAVGFEGTAATATAALAANFPGGKKVVRFELGAAGPTAGAFAGRFEGGAAALGAAGYPGKSVVEGEQGVSRIALGDVGGVSQDGVQVRSCHAVGTVDQGIAWLACRQASSFAQTRLTPLPALERT